MDVDGPSSGRRKVRFAPKAPQSSRKPKLAVAKSDETSDEDEEAAQAQYLLGRFNENLTRQKPKVEKKSSVQIAFGPGAPSSTSLRSYGNKRAGRILDDSSSTSKEDCTDICSSDAIEAPAPRVKSEYREPWDYNRTYYPTTLPLRRPYSGDPELLDEAEFVETAKKEYDETTINPASDLGLLEEGDKQKMLFFQFPGNLPRIKQPVSKKGKEKAEHLVSSDRFGALKKGCRLEELPEGYVGKMLVYKSGAVKLKIGETLFDASTGEDCVFAQDVAAFNTASKQCCVIGEVGQRVVVTPDFCFL